MLNTSDEPIEVLWDRCAYLDAEGQSHPVKAVRRKRKVPAPSLVPPHGALEQLLRPMADQREHGLDPLLPPGPRPLLLSPRYVGDPLFLPANSRQLVGRDLGVYLVFAKARATKTVMATYRIAQVNVR